MGKRYDSYSTLVGMLLEAKIEIPANSIDQPGDRLSMTVEALSGDLKPGAPVPEFLKQTQGRYFSKKREELAAYLRATTGSDIFNAEDFAGPELASYSLYVQKKIMKPKK